jgi:UDP-N-acetylmuramyl pentapeptide phosphotransferase/UDP-N-acetylglucosamine-1-phosphate transferase
VIRHPNVSAWFCLAVVIYPVWEVVFSILRRLKATGKRATEPDKMHLHHVAMRSRKLSNPKTSVILVAAFLPFQVVSLFFYNKGYVLFGIILIFVILYSVGYAKYSRSIKK